MLCQNDKRFRLALKFYYALYSLSFIPARGLLNLQHRDKKADSIRMAVVTLIMFSTLSDHNLSIY